jgi:pimeloyl-ACP methyl ester carboxylesterase
MGPQPEVVIVGAQAPGQTVVIGNMVGEGPAHLRNSPPAELDFCCCFGFTCSLLMFIFALYTALPGGEGDYVHVGRQTMGRSTSPIFMFLQLVLIPAGIARFVVLWRRGPTEKDQKLHKLFMTFSCGTALFSFISILLVITTVIAGASVAGEIGAEADKKWGGHQFGFRETPFSFGEFLVGSDCDMSVYEAISAPYKIIEEEAPMFESRDIPYYGEPQLEDMYELDEFQPMLSIDVYAKSLKHYGRHAILSVHGGGWWADTGREKISKGVACHLLQLGYVFASAAVRGLGHGWSMEDGEEDLVSALVALKAETGGGVLVLGQGTGSLLAARLAYRHPDLVKGFVSISGAIRTTGKQDDYVIEDEDIRTQYFWMCDRPWGGESPWDTPDHSCWELHDPLTYVGPSGPPAVFISPLWDSVYPTANHQTMADKLREADIEVQEVEIPHAGHNCVNVDGSPCAQISTYVLERFAAHVFENVDIV